MLKRLNEVMYIKMQSEYQSMTTPATQLVRHLLLLLALRSAYPAWYTISDLIYEHLISLYLRHCDYILVLFLDQRVGSTKEESG